MINQEQLEKLLADVESYNVEKTISTDKMDKFCEAICAFSNDISGSEKNGYLLIGLNDNGTLSGLKVDDSLFLKISNIRTDGNILPQPLMNVEKFSLSDGDVLVVEVQPSECPPVRYKGRTWVRVGPRKSIASQAEEKKLSERRLLHVKSFDAHPCLGATIEDIDVDLFKKEYLSKAIAADVLSEDKRSIQEQLESLRFFDSRYNAPTNAAIFKEFLKEKEERSFVINGEWGSGKTYFWKNTLTQIAKEEKKIPIHISLARVGSITDSERLIAKKILLPTFEKISEKKKSKFVGTMKVMKDIESQVANKKLGFDLLEASLNYGIELHDYTEDVICFDDLERCNIEIKELLGFIGDFIESNSAKVLILGDF